MNSKKKYTSCDFIFPKYIIPDIWSKFNVFSDSCVE